MKFRVKVHGTRTTGAARRSSSSPPAQLPLGGVAPPAAMPEPDPERFGPPAGGASISRSSPPGSAFSSDSNISVASSVGVSRAASSPEDSSTKRSMEKAKESAVLGSPQPTPLASPIRAENRVKCSWELFHPHLASVSPDLKSVTALRDLTCCAALGHLCAAFGHAFLLARLALCAARLASGLHLGLGDLAVVVGIHRGKARRLTRGAVGRVDHAVRIGVHPVSYTHLTLPTKRIV